MIALAIVLTAIVLLLAVLVAGLLRSHADILKALHDLGVGVGDPVGPPVGRHSRVDDHDSPQGAPLVIGPPLPAERSSTSAPTIAGVAPNGDAVAVAPASGGALTLLAFLSSGCRTCGTFWSSFHDLDHMGFPEDTRLVAVTKGPELEAPGVVAEVASPGLVVVMSTQAWSDYEVPGSPFFVLVDGVSGRRIGEGVANQLAQVAELVRRAALDDRQGKSQLRSRPRRGPRRARAGAGQRPGAPRRRRDAGRPQPLSAVAGRPLRSEGPLLGTVGTREA